jgi:hypothetical protein
MSDKYSCYLFNNVPGVWENLTYAVFAVSKYDAYNYMKSLHDGGKCIGEVKHGKVDANIGAVTDRAQEIISKKYREWIKQ